MTKQSPQIPSFFAQRVREGGPQAVTDLLDACKTKGSGMRIGIALSMPGEGIAYWKRNIPDWTSRADAILADPEMARLDAEQLSTAALEKAPYLGGSPSSSDETAYVRDVLRRQVNIGANLLVTPWRRLSGAQAKKRLKTTERWARIGHKIATEEGWHTCYGVEIATEMTQAEEDRETILERLVDLPEAPVYLKLQTPPDAGRQQVRDYDTLTGWIDLVQTLEESGHGVICARSDLTGWLLCAMGASAFSAGASISSARVGGPDAPKIKRKKVPKVHHFFVPELLMFVRSEELSRIYQASGLDPCQCPFCIGAPPHVPGNYDPTRAGQHLCWNLTRMAHRMAKTSNRRNHAKTLVKSATAYWSKIRLSQLRLADTSRPRHLDAWSQLLGIQDDE